MSSHVVRLLLSLLALVSLGLTACGGDSTPAPGSNENGTARPGETSAGWSDEFSDNGKLNVATTVAPISSIVRNIGGTRINLRGIVPDGADSHTFEPAPSDAAILARADMFIMNGLHLEQPTKDLAEANLPDGAPIVELGTQAITPEQYVYDFSFPRDGGNPNPHLWTDVTKAQRYAEIVLAALKDKDPANAEYYQKNFDLYNVKLQALHEAMKAATATIPEQNRKLLTYHDSFPFFGATYGFKIIGAIQPSDFSEPSAKEVADLIEQIKAEKVPAIFGSEVFPSPVLEQIASETGAKYIDKIRDDEPPGEPGSVEHTYVGMMLSNMRLIAEGLGGNADALSAVTPDDTYLP